MSAKLCLEVNEHVDRNQQLEQIANKIQKLREGKTEFKSVSHYFGIPGIGKTTLGLMLQKLCENMAIPFVRIDFDFEKNPDTVEYKKDKILILNDILIGLQSIPSGFDELIGDYHNAQNEDLRMIQLKDILNKFITHINELSAKTPIVILFDTVEKLEEIDNKLCGWLEDNIIGHLAVTGRCLLISTGRYDKRWKTFQVRRHLVSEMVDSFPSEITEEQIRAIVGSDERVAEISKPIHSVTCGYPLGNKELALEAQKNKKLTRSEMINLLADEIIGSYVMKNLTSELKAVIRVLAVVRQFDVYILRIMVSEFLQVFNEKSGMMMDGLAKTSLIQWDEKLKGYALDKIVRHVLSQHLQLNQAERFLQINRKAAEIYEEYIEKSPDNRNVYIRERLYHHANIGYCNGKSQTDIISELQLKLNEYLEKYYQQHEPRYIAIALIRIEKELENDTEMVEIVGESGFEKLKETIETYRQKLQLSK